jgi:hypothetical protein
MDTSLGRVLVDLTEQQCDLAMPNGKHGSLVTVALVHEAEQTRAEGGRQEAQTPAPNVVNAQVLALALQLHLFARGDQG